MKALLYVRVSSKDQEEGYSGLSLKVAEMKVAMVYFWQREETSREVSSDAQTLSPNRSLGVRTKGGAG